MKMRVCIFVMLFALSLSLPASNENPITYTALTKENLTSSGTFKSPVSVIYWDFDDDDGNFTSGGLGSWAWGPPSTPPLGTVNQAWETGGPDNYPDLDCSWLDSPVFFIEGPSAFLTFRHHFTMQEYADGGNVQISLDGGQTFQVIFPQQGYPYPPPPDVICPEGLDGPVYSGSSGTYEIARFDLGPFAGNYAILRWVFESDGAVNFQGWIIDDVRITSSRLSPQFPGCDISRDNCGALTPSSATSWIADGSGLTNNGTLFFVDVPSYGDGVFQVDPVTCDIVDGTYYSVSYYGTSERGIAYDPEYHDIWHGGWDEGYILQNDAAPPYEFISATYTGLAIASMAVDDANNYLFVGTNSYPDYVYVYGITGGTLGTLLGAWAVPWQAQSDGWDMAGMEFDPDAGLLVMINQYGSYSGTDIEAFDFSLGSGLTGAGWCDLANTGFGWGMGLIGDSDPAPASFYAYVTDIGDFAAPVDLDEYGIPAVLPPYGLTCSVTPENDVQLTWTNWDAYDSIRIYRDFALIATLPGGSTSYLDVGPGLGVHHYGVSGTIGSDESGQAGCDVNIYPPGQTCFDFNGTPQGWSAGGTSNGWEWGTPTYIFELEAWETAVGGYYDANACTWLDSPVINAGPEGMWVTFDTYDHTECYWDGWTLEISVDGGATWSCIYPLEGYDQGVPYGAYACGEFLSCDSNCGYGVVRHWNFDLTGMPNVSAMFRFVFASDSSVQYYGTTMDNFCVNGGAVPAVMVQCQLLNPDMDGDGVRDVHVCDYLYYSATFINLTADPVDYGAEHFFYATQSCPDPSGPVDHFGPGCKGTLPGGGVYTHYYRVSVPNNNNLVDFNPFAVEVAAWQCESGVPQMETSRCCFDVTLLPAWELPPGDPAPEEPPDDFVVEEMDMPPLFVR